MNKFPLSGFLAVNKPKNWTSFDVVSKTRSILNGAKVGHSGTLDPNATGLLVLGINRGTRFLEFLIKTEKIYEGEIFLGANSSTDDIEGEIKNVKNFEEPDLEEIEKIINERFIGEFLQKPPYFSAVKIKGKKSYESARKGEILDIPSKKVEAKKIEVLDFNFPILKLKIECSSGFYVRSLARDLGKIIGCGGYLKNLKRTKVGKIDLSSAQEIEEIKIETLEKHLLGFQEVSPLGKINLERNESFHKGKIFKGLNSKENIVLLISGNKFAIAEKKEDIFIVKKVL